jgi:hypothetical protein
MRPNFRGYFPTNVTLAIEANTLIEAGDIVIQNANKRAIPGAASAGAALTVAGIAKYTVDNRTGSALGGAAGAADVDCELGMWDLATADNPALKAQLYVLSATSVTTTVGTNTPCGVARNVVKSGFVTVDVGR